MQTQVQLFNEYREKEKRTFRVYSVLTQKFTDSENLKETVREFEKYKLLGDLFETIIRRNKSSV